MMRNRSLYLFFPLHHRLLIFNPSPAMVAELRTFPVSITYPVGEVHDAPGILAVGEAERMPKLVHCFGSSLTLQNE